MRNVIHDCYVDIYGFKPTEVIIMRIATFLPLKILLLAEQWGWNDTEVGDGIYRWMKERKEMGK